MKHCLIVDDSRLLRKVASGILASMGYETCEADDGAVALASCKKAMPDVVLLDMQMPDMSAVEFVRSLRRQKDGGRPFVVLCTTENDVLRITEAINAGADQYVLKPFDRDAIAAGLAQAHAS